MFGVQSFRYYPGPAYPLDSVPRNDPEMDYLYDPDEPATPFKAITKVPRQWAVGVQESEQESTAFGGLGDGSVVVPSTSTDILTLIENNWMWILGALALAYLWYSSQKKKG